jgi:hypothetical protein
MVRAHNGSLQLKLCIVFTIHRAKKKYGENKEAAQDRDTPKVWRFTPLNLTI